jgi:hypothetical protein
VTRLLSVILAGSFLASSIGCGNVFVRGAIQPGSTIQGSVSTVRIGSVLNGTGADEAGLFPTNQTVFVNFNPGHPSATVITVVIVG